MITTLEYCMRTHIDKSSDPFVASYVKEVILCHRERKTKRNSSRLAQHNASLANVLKNTTKLNHLFIATTQFSGEFVARILPVLKTLWRGQSTLRRLTLEGPSTYVSCFVLALH